MQGGPSLLAPSCSACLYFSALFSFSFVAGAVTVLQSTLNQQLGLILGLFTFATFISFSIGLVILTFLVVVEAQQKSLPLLLTWKARPSPLLFLAGPCGVLCVTASIYVTLFIGFALFYLCFVVGQLAAAIAADACGYGVQGGVKIAPTLPRLLLLALALAGVALSVVEALLPSSSSAAAFPPANLGWCALAALVGAASLVQSVLNRAAAALLPSQLQATWWSFFVGTLLALLVFGAQAAALGGGPPRLAAALSDRAAALQLQHFLGGPLGVLFVFAAVFVPSLIGSQAYSVALVSGQLVCSAVMDSLGGLGATARALSPLRVAGVAVVLAAAAGMQAVRGRTLAACLAQAGCSSSGGGGGSGSGSLAELPALALGSPPEPAGAALSVRAPG